ncbi:hypothetical protein QWY93_03860 [Echinicola jeungdonensis]|uniref:Uncharacterized protein n=1 Tax=Echinicola jeungdonensis TaxID=709343 RepID=A0ABV5J1D5_9BACT|nr:hypothetical protein [Echinicola jeungdonensis]MDN3668461.1 hypothetical protein [Echinicola jeungdonensis]
MNEYRILLDILFILGGLYLAFFKSYFTEKGKSVATKEDIEEITQKVEIVKTEVLYLNNQRSQWNDENKKALLDFYDSFNRILFIFQKDVTKTILSHPFETPNYRLQIEDLNFDFHSKYSKLYIRRS